MSDKNSEIIEAAKAIQESASTAGKAIEALREVGGFFSRVFGGVVEDSVGIVADSVKFYRIERVIRLADRASEKLRDRGFQEADSRLDSVSLKIGISLIEAAAIEQDDELQDLWSNLLANAMDPNFDDDIDMKFVSILKELSSIDVLILDYLYKVVSSIISDPDFIPNEPFDVGYLSTELKRDIRDVQLSVMNLIRLGCLNRRIDISGAPVTSVGAGLGQPLGARVIGQAMVDLNEDAGVSLTILGFKLRKSIDEVSSTSNHGN